MLPQKLQRDECQHETLDLFRGNEAYPFAENLTARLGASMARGGNRPRYKRPKLLTETTFGQRCFVRMKAFSLFADPS